MDNLRPLHGTRRAYVPSHADRASASMAQVAYGVAQSQRYTDALIAEIRSQINADAAENYRDRYHSMRSRVTMHMALMAVGMCIALLIPSAVIIGILATGMPSLIIEITDHHVIVASMARKLRRENRK